MTANFVQGCIIVFAVIICATSAFGVYSPGRLIDLVMSVWEKKASLHLAVVVRLALGALLILAAPSTKFPVVFQTLGWLAIVAAIIIPFAGRERINRFIGWWARRPRFIVRMWCLLGVVFGGFLFYGVS